MSERWCDRQEHFTRMGASRSIDNIAVAIVHLKKHMRLSKIGIRNGHCLYCDRTGRNSRKQVARETFLYQSYWIWHKATKEDGGISSVVQIDCLAAMYSVEFDLKWVLPECFFVWYAMLLVTFSLLAKAWLAEIWLFPKHPIHTPSYLLSNCTLSLLWSFEIAIRRMCSNNSQTNAFSRGDWQPWKPSTFDKQVQFLHSCLASANNANNTTFLFHVLRSFQVGLIITPLNEEFSEQHCCPGQTHCPKRQRMNDVSF